MSLAGLIDTYRHSRDMVGCGIWRSIYRAIRYELTGKYFPR